MPAKSDSHVCPMCGRPRRNYRLPFLDSYLTTREAEILKHLELTDRGRAKYGSRKQLAEKLRISVKSVDTYIWRMLHRHGVVCLEFLIRKYRSS